MAGKRGDTLSPAIPSAQEVNRLYQKTQDAAGKYDFANECLDGAGPETTTNLENAYDDFLAAANTRRVSLHGNPPHETIDDLFLDTFANYRAQHPELVRFRSQD
jgi:hypothetical protein